VNGEWKVTGGALLGTNWTFKVGSQASKNYGKDNSTTLGG